MINYEDAFKLDMPMQLRWRWWGWWRWRWWWRWWAGSESHNRYHRVKTRLIVWLGMSPRLLSQIQTMTYAWYQLFLWELMVGFSMDNWMPDISEVEIWRTGSLWMFLLSLLCTLLLHWIPAQYNWHRQGFLPPPAISQMEVEFPLAPDLLKGCPEQHWSVVGLMGSYICVGQTVVWLFSSLATLVQVYATQCICTYRGGWCNGMAACDVSRAGH